MNRWIDADALHDALKAKQKWVVRCGDKHNEGYTYDQVHFAIDDAPSIDIVRCKECKKLHDCRGDAWQTSVIEKGHIGWCNRTSRIGTVDYVKENDFCSYGEREGE